MDWKVNQILYTRDGRSIGNAIITKVLDDKKYLILTDYGNKVKLTSEEVTELFYTPAGLKMNQPVMADETHKNFQI